MDLRDFNELSDADIERIFSDKPEPHWMTWCRLNERWLGDIAVVVVCSAAPIVLWMLRVI